jgi:nifR3 family TIM-barrel protein
MGVLAGLLRAPLSISGHPLDSRLVLAPMAMLGHVAFRELVARFGGYGLLFSEMCSAKRLVHENPRVSPCFRWRKEELPKLVCQIFGAEPDEMAAAARRIEEEGFFGVDINFGCAAGEICRLNGGAAVLKDPPLAGRIVSAVRGAVSIPVFVKFRTGWKDDARAAADMARRFEASGADALTFHPRVAPDRRAHPPRWDHITRIKSNVSIPVFGNGNVFQPADCLRMLRETGCDGVAVGRMAVATPWLFAEWTGRKVSDSPAYEACALELANLLETHFAPQEALRRFKKFARYFAANFKFGHTFHTAILRAKDMASAARAASDFLRSAPELLAEPNMNFFR